MFWGFFCDKRSRRCPEVFLKISRGLMLTHVEIQAWGEWWTKVAAPLHKVVPLFLPAPDPQTCWLHQWNSLLAIHHPLHLRQYESQVIKMYCELDMTHTVKDVNMVQSLWLFVTMCDYLLIDESYTQSISIWRVGIMTQQSTILQIGPFTASILSGDLVE